MTIRPLVILPDPVLRLGSEPVGPITGEIRTLVADMFETMYDAPGVGLAAIQIGVAKRVVTIDTSKERRASATPGSSSTPRSSGPLRKGGSTTRAACRFRDYYAEVERPDRSAREVPRHRRQRAGDRGRRPALDLHPARDRPSERRAVHRPSVEAEARPGDQEVHQGGQRRDAACPAMRVVFMGTPDFAVPTLARLAQDGHDIVAVYTRAPAKAGRGMSLRPPRSTPSPTPSACRS